MLASQQKNLRTGSFGSVYNLLQQEVLGTTFLKPMLW